MQTIRKILSEKGNDIWSTSPGATVFEALQIMADKDVGALPVLEHDKLVGIFSERDYARKVILVGKSSKKTLVKEIMTPHVVYATPDMTNEQGLTLMTAKHIRHLPVVEEDDLTGMVSIGDLVRSIISEQKEMITQLEQYILHYTSIT
jgi:CBS domain-containing protein